MATKRTGLGRGINALIPNSGANSSKKSAIDVFFDGDDGAERIRAVADATAEIEPVVEDQGSKRPKRRKGEEVPSETSPSSNTDEAKAATAAQDDATMPPGGDELEAIPGVQLAQLDPAWIVANAVQPRTEFDEDALEELIVSVREVGVMQPIVVRPLASDDPRRTAEQRFELVMGERRLRATRANGLTTIPAVVRDTADENMLRDALLENLHRANLNPLEEASAYEQLLSDFGVTQEVLSQRIGRSRSQIANTIRLLRLPEPVQRRVAAGVLSAGHARAILSAGTPEAMQHLADRVVNEDLSVRATETLAAGVKPASKRKTPTQGSVHNFLDEIGERLGDRLDTRVQVQLGRRKGQVVIEFATIADLNRILTELGERDYSAMRSDSDRDLDEARAAVRARRSETGAVLRSPE